MDYGEGLRRSPISSLYNGSGPRPLALRLLRGVEGQYGWLVFGLVLLLACCIPLAIQDIQWLDNVSILWPTVLVAVAAGMTVARRGGRAVAEALGGAIVGCAGIFLVLGQVMPTARRVRENLEALFAWLVQPLTRHAVTNPLPHGLGVTFDRIAAFALQIMAWWHEGGSGEPAIDNRIFLFILAVVTWSVTYFMVWALYRGMNPIAAVMPLGVSLISFVVLGGQGSHYVVLFLVCTLLLLMRLHFMSLERRWNRRRVDYPSSVSVEVFVTGSVFIALIAVLSIYLPSAPQNVLAVKFWGLFNGPWSTLEANVGEAFTGVRHRVGGNAGSDLFLGGGLAEGGNTTVMYVQSDEPPPPDMPEEQLQAMGYVEPVHYFVGAAFVEYDGHSWGNTGKIKGRSHYGVAIGPGGEPVYEGEANDQKEQVQNRLPNQPVNPSIAGATKIVQHVEMVENQGGLMYAYDVPVQLDQPYKAHVLAGTVTRVDLEGIAKKYTVVSEILDPTAPQLRSAPTTYPSSVAPYLQLPSIPERVVAEAKQWTASSRSPYDKALALQENLRKIPYSADVPAPPRGADAVDYFLFDAKAGYCEYYASAMVVMARSLGIPARVVSGYATTTYDHAKGAYDVDESDAHTWVQIFFPTVGWVDFEPTPINPAMVRAEGDAVPGDLVVPAAEAPPATERPAFLAGIDRRILIGAAFVLLAAFVAYAMRRQWEAELTAEAMITIVYGRLCRVAGWFGKPRRQHETSLEYGYRLAERFALAHEPVAERIRRIAVLYVLARYAGQSLGAAEKQEVRAAWRQVRGHLWQLRRSRTPLAALDEAA